jgi:glutamine amidotransferase
VEWNLHSITSRGAEVIQRWKMCRLYAFHASQRAKVDCGLIQAQNRLLTRVQRDPLGRTHPDGWGIGSYESGHPIIQRSAGQGDDEANHFSTTADSVRSGTVVAHVRFATVGVAGVHNCHPFRWGGWMFAHAGTVTAESKLRSQLEHEMGEDFAGLIHGTTDSELLFHWICSRLRNSNLIDAERCFDLGRLRDGLSELIVEIDRRNDLAGASQPASLNLVLTDGEILIATRLRESLHWLQRRGVQECDVCGQSHAATAHGDGYRITIIASRPVSPESWEPLPDGSMITVDGDCNASVTPLAAQRRTSRADSSQP